MREGISFSFRIPPRDKILLEIISRKDRRPMAQEILYLIQRRAAEMGLAEPEAEPEKEA